MTEEGRPTSASLPSRVVFFGSGGFGVPILGSIASLPGTRLVGAVTLPDRPSGRHAALTPTPVAVAAERLGVPLFRMGSVRSADALERISALRPDVGVLADFGRIVPADLLDLPERGILNVHPSLLPRHRGATPVAATILAGDEEAGVTVIVMDEGVDTGPIVAQESWPLLGRETAPALEAKAAELAAALVRRVVPAWLSGSIVSAPQPTEGGTLTRPFRRDDGRLDPTLPAARLERMVRALEPWPGTFVDTSAGRLGVLAASVVPSAPDDEAGRLVADHGGLALATSDGRLRLERVLPSGRRPMTGAEYARGAGRSLVGTRIGTQAGS
ncbi:MAG TPA: methionyl-tRNA formyltransferase [Candidatus Dormibacteraeota bacterium]|nr:methionyl-tRNA formyltransferase [Candidatus Dormibacteraeota bacterium]